ncbi:hypothetical protein N7468_000802 [Penicillium chermesinum]|uniref:GP-PDE domain-containing protein n=1 Tax=Penicillium chermesinum TaxID=63820 RepID=A0A9W9PFN1_9EURO|nr:uncharacterized protein N7468_000802 [Penicillium chermesinum]KAJ5245819.1 hypothetical protein N7468_000802 [Penicillium chermesinum]
MAESRSAARAVDTSYSHPATSKSSPRLPDVISHRGYKAKYPENTLCAIDKAVQAGTNALELDLHLSKDGVIVLSHDPTLKRCYGIDKKVAECDWDYLKTLRTINAPHEPMPRLLDVLRLANDPTTIMRRIAEALESVPVLSGPGWPQRIVLGCWSARYVAPRAQYLPEYELTLICVHMDYARQFLQIPNVSFNANQYILLGPLGRGFMEEALAARRKVYLWTVNEVNLMRWGIRHGAAGIITDYPALYKQVREEWEKEQKEGSPDPQLERLTLGQRAYTVLIMFFALTFGWMLRRKHLPPLDREHIELGKTD